MISRIAYVHTGKAQLKLYGDPASVAGIAVQLQRSPNSAWQTVCQADLVRPFAAAGTPCARVLSASSGLCA